MTKKPNIDDQYTPKMIDYRLDTSRDLIPNYARLPLARSLALLPKNVIDFIIENYVFISQSVDEDGTHYNLDHLYFKNTKGFILLNSNLWEKRPIQIAFTVAHEVSHAFKDHGIKNIEDTEIEIGIKREKEADALAVKWLSKHYKKESLKRFCHSHLYKRYRPSM